jgi:putative flavoprotein involved in K+ transport
VDRLDSQNGNYEIFVSDQKFIANNIVIATGTKDGFPIFEDNSVLKVSSIIWATGYKSDFSWIGMDVTDAQGLPLTERGISTVKKGFYFIGILFQFGLTSGLVGDVGRDAAYISRHILHN